MGNVKNIFCGLWLMFIFLDNAYAIDNFNDIKPHSYGLNNLSIGVTPGVYSSISDSDNYKDSYGNGVGLLLHSKSSLKQYHYKRGEWFWDGGVSAYLIKNKYTDKPNTNNLDLNIFSGIGLSSNYKKLINAVSMGLGYRHISNEDSNKNDGSSDTFGSAYLYGEYAIGSNFKDIPIGIIYKAMIMEGDANQNNQDKSDFIFEQRLRMPIQVNKNRDHAITYTPEIRFIKHGNYKEANILLTIGLSWIYR